MALAEGRSEHSIVRDVRAIPRTVALVAPLAEAASTGPLDVTGREASNGGAVGAGTDGASDGAQSALAVLVAER